MNMLSKVQSKYFRLIFFILATIGLFGSAPFPRSQRIILLICFELSMVYLLGKKIVTDPEKKFNSVLVVGASTCTVLILLELVFLFIPKSHGVGNTLAARLWHKMYWYPMDTLGSRDIMPTHTLSENKQTVLVVGDSFGAGHGIREVADRFSNKLEKKSGGRLQIYNISQNGIDTRREFELLQRVPFSPEVLVLSYFINDIEPAATQAGLNYSMKRMERKLPLLLPAALVERSFFFNFLYWEISHPGADDYLSYLKAAYGSKDIFGSHLRDLRRFVDYCESRSCKLVVVLFPSLIHVQETGQLLKPIENFFTQQNIPVVRVQNLVEGMSLAERIVNKNDAHPSIDVHERVAQSLSELIGPITYGQ